MDRGKNMSNYERTKNQMCAEFLGYDQEKMIERFGFEADERFLKFRFLGSGCRVDRQTGVVECADPATGEFSAADFNEAMTVYDLLCWSKPGAAPCGRYMNLQSLARLCGAASWPGNSGFAEQARLFDGRTEALVKAAERLGGRPVSGGDAAAEIPVFGELRAILRFWASDDEFEPQLQILWDENTLMYMHYETAWYASAALLRRVCALV